jgi:molecular chaperone Hsp33
VFWSHCVTEPGIVAETAADHVLAFTVPTLDVRGRIARLGASLDQILSAHHYPHAVSLLLGEAVILTTLLGSALKFSGRFQLQTKSNGPVQALIVDYETPGTVRAMARFDASAVTEAVLQGTDLLGHGHLGLTIDQGKHMSQYQGLVELDGTGLQAAADRYFQQSEQIPTFVKVAVGQLVGKDGLKWNGGGLIVQFLPESTDRMRGRDLPPGDAPSGYEVMAGRDDDAWIEARVLAQTLEDHELIDPTLASEDIAYRLYHERGIFGSERQSLHASCRCSRDRIQTMLRNFSSDDQSAMIADDGQIAVTCEFCSVQYSFTPESLAQDQERQD